MIRYRIVFGTNSPKVREKLISKGSALTLDKAVELARSFEASQAQLSAMAGSSTNNSEETVHLVQKQNTGKGPQGTQPSNFCLVLLFFFGCRASACAGVSLTTSDVFLTCDTTHRTGLRAKLQLKARVCCGEFFAM